MPKQQSSRIAGASPPAIGPIEIGSATAAVALSKSGERQYSRKVPAVGWGVESKVSRQTSTRREILQNDNP